MEKLGQAWVSRVTKSDGPEVSVIGGEMSTGADLRKYGRHLTSCAVWFGEWREGDRDICTCGFADALLTGTPVMKKDEEEKDTRVGEPLRERRGVTTAGSD